MGGYLNPNDHLDLSIVSDLVGGLYMDMVTMSCIQIWIPMPLLL